MALSDPLNARQIQVLQWVADGCPPGQWSDSKFKTTAAALQSRRLITVSKRGGSWTAKIEPAGQYYLDHDAFPVGHFDTRRPARPPRRSEVPGPAKPVMLSMPMPMPMPMTGAELLDRLRSEGTITVPAPSDAQRAAWRRTINAAQVSDALNGDEQVTFKGRDTGDLVIALGARRSHRPAPPTVPAVDAQEIWPVESKRFAAEPGLLTVSEDSRPRAIGIVQRLAVEVAHRGYVLQPRPKDVPGFQLGRLGYTQDYDVTEEYDDAEVYPEEAIEAKKYNWQRVSPERRRLPSGRLTITGYSRYSRRTWADRKRWRLDDKLPELLAEFEAAAQEHEDRRIRRENETARLKREWEAAIVDARKAFITDHNAKRLSDQIDRYDQADRLRRYAAQLHDITRSADVERAEHIRAWAEFAETQADHVDPVQNQEDLMFKTPIEIGGEDLKPFLLRGMNPYWPPEPRA